ncbi:MAG: hypothetical protein ACXV5S_05320 [Acidimicrobiales bacterium]
MHTVLAAAATLLATAFALSTLERYLARGRRHELMWTISLFMFALGSLALWLGAAIGWSEWTFKAFYLFGAILNVPFLALGTVYLLGGQRRGDIAAASVSLLSAFAAGIVVATPIVGVIASDVLPQGSDVFGVGPRIAAGVGSGVAAMVIIGGAIWSAVQLLLGRRRSAAAPPTAIPAGRLAAANLLIAAGTLILSAGGLLNSVVDEMNAFAISLVVGIAVIFAGFLLTTVATPAGRAGPGPVRGSLEPGPVRATTDPAERSLSPSSARPE